MQTSLFQLTPKQSDVVFTPDWCARDIIEHFRPQGRILDPCCGDGAFLRYLPGAEWCELSKGKDFFAWSEPVDWIIGNPPYSIFSDWLKHSLSLAKNICYLIPIAKVFSVESRMREIYAWGGIVETAYYGKGDALGFPFGFPCGAVYMRKGYHGGTTFVFRSCHNNVLHLTQKAGRENALLN